MVDILIDGVQEVLLFPAKLSGPQHVTHTLVEVGVLALEGQKAEMTTLSTKWPRHRRLSSGMTQTGGGGPVSTWFIAEMQSLAKGWVSDLKDIIILPMVFQPLLGGEILPKRPKTMLYNCLSKMVLAWYEGADQMAHTGLFHFYHFEKCSHASCWHPSMILCQISPLKPGLLKPHPLHLYYHKDNQPVYINTVLV